MAQGQKRTTLNALGSGFDSHSKKRNIIFNVPLFPSLYFLVTMCEMLSSAIRHAIYYFVSKIYWKRNNMVASQNFKYLFSSLTKIVKRNGRNQILNNEAKAGGFPQSFPLVCLKFRAPRILMSFLYII